MSTVRTLSIVIVHTQRARIKTAVCILEKLALHMAYRCLQCMQCADDRDTPFSQLHKLLFWHDPCVFGLAEFTILISLWNIQTTRCLFWFIASNGCVEANYDFSFDWWRSFGAQAKVTLAIWSHPTNLPSQPLQTLVGQSTIHNWQWPEILHAFLKQKPLYLVHWTLW